MTTAADVRLARHGERLDFLEARADEHKNQIKAIADDHRSEIKAIHAKIDKLVYSFLGGAALLLLNIVLHQVGLK